MKDKPENVIPNRQLSSQSKILSSFSHELRNHTAIINESKGLLQDYIEMGKISGDETIAKFARILAIIDTRSELIADMANHLNRYAHRLNTTLVSVNMNELLTEQLYLLKRYARLRKISVSKHFITDPLRVTLSPPLLHLIFSHFFDIAIMILKENDSLVISSELKDNEITVFFTLDSSHKLSIPQELKLPPPEIQLCLSKTNSEMLIQTENESKYVKAFGFRMKSSGS